MSPLRLIFDSLVYHRRMHVATAFGVTVGAAVLTGALLVGDSMRGSLRQLVLDGLGRIDCVLIAPGFFRAALVDELAAEANFRQRFETAVPVILLEGSAESADSQSASRAGKVQILGCDGRFFTLGRGGPKAALGRRDVVLNEPLAKQLGVQAGSEIMLRLPKRQEIPADSPLGKKRDLVAGIRLRVAEVIPCAGLGRFSLRPSQRLPHTAFVDLKALGQELDVAGKCNAIFVGGETGQMPKPEDAAILARLLRPTFADYGLRIEKTPRGYLDITSESMILPNAVVEAVAKAIPADHHDSVLTYLATTMACGDREIPYSTIAAMSLADRPPLGPMLDREGNPIGPIAEDQIVLNAWAADQLAARVGDAIRVTFFEPESTHGAVVEKTIELKLAAVVRLEGAAADRALTPSVPGVTDQMSMNSWDPPFPFEQKRVRKEDEKYWDDYRATPKAFVAPATGRRYWASRFGEATSCRIVPQETDSAESIAAKIHLDPAAMGFVFQPVKFKGLTAATGTTPFEALFLGFSLFLIASAVMLVALMFHLGIDRRAAELGILKATGWSQRRLGQWLMGEAVVVAALGSLVGVPCGIGYAALMLLGLRTWWLAAVSTPFLQLHITGLSLVAGFLCGILVAMLAIRRAVRRLGRMSPRQLLGGRSLDDTSLNFQGRRHAGALALTTFALAALLGAVAWRMGEEARAGAFFAAGAMVLTASIGWVSSRLRSGATGPAVAVGGSNLRRLALRGAARNPGRSTLAIGLVAAAVFLLVAVSAFQIDSTTRAPSKASGDGGFSIVAESDQPIFVDLNTPEGRSELGLTREEETALASCQFYGLRVSAGDDASCLNLYRPQRPRILGIPKVLEERGGFAWAAAETTDKPWAALDAATEIGIPVAMDKNTANYSLQLWRGVGERFEIPGPNGEPLQLAVAGLLGNSIFQGDLLMGEAEFLKHFPGVSGYRFFLVETPPERTQRVAKILRKALGDYGLTTETSPERLAAFAAVQNTYLSTFQSLGGLGLLLGTLGLGAVQLRSVFQRRGELALMRAEGFRQSQLARLVLMENAALVVLGLGIGILAALLAVLPHLAGQGAAIPWKMLAICLALVLLAGLASGGLAVRAVLKLPLSGELRREA